MEISKSPLSALPRYLWPWQRQVAQQGAQRHSAFVKLGTWTSQSAIGWSTIIELGSPKKHNYLPWGAANIGMENTEFCGKFI